MNLVPVRTIDREKNAVKLIAIASTMCNSCLDEQEWLEASRCCRHADECTQLVISKIRPGTARLTQPQRHILSYVYVLILPSDCVDDRTFLGHEEDRLVACLLRGTLTFIVIDKQISKQNLFLMQD